MALFLTGATGYIGSYVATGLLREYSERLVVLVRARTTEDAHRRLWKSLQLHMGFEEFADYLSRIDVVLGDLTSPRFGLDGGRWDGLVRKIDSVIHVAASLNRKSAKACFNVNLRGTLEVIKLARAAQDRQGIRRFSDVSTVAVSGHRKDEVVREENTIDWDRSDYDPYARTKRFCEHMLQELLPDVPHTVFRPATVLGDSRFPQTTQFDMVRAFATLAYLPVVPLRADWKIDIVSADYVARAIVTIHQKDEPRHDAYNLGSGIDSPTYGGIVSALREHGHPIRSIFVPVLQRPFSATIDRLVETPRRLGVSLPASLMKVFWPYLTYNTVFDNSRIVAELGDKPRPFTEYCHPLLRFAVDNRFKYPYLPWPEARSVGRGPIVDRETA